VKLEELADTFDHADTATWTFTASTVVAGRLTMGAPLDPGWSGVLSVATPDATESFLQLDTSVFPDGGASTQLRISLQVDAWDLNAVEYLASGAFGLDCAVWMAGVRTVVRTHRYDRFSHRWLRIAEYGGQVTWEASPDGLEWAQLASWSSTLNLTAVRVRIAGDRWAPGDTDGTATVDNLNVLQGTTDPATITGDEGFPYLAVDVQPDLATGVFTLDASQLDGPDVLAWSDVDPGAWLNIVCDVRQLRYRRGAARLQGLLTQTEAGTATVVLADTADIFDPMVNAHAIHKGTPLRMRAWGTDAEGYRWDAVLFTADVDQVAVQYSKDDAPLVTVTAVDLVGPLNGWQSPGELPVGAGEDLRTRALRLLELVGRGYLSPRSDEQYVATLAGTELARPWQELTEAAEAELGRVWIDRHNRLVTQNRNSELAGPVRGTLSDVHGEAPQGVHCCVADAVVVYGAENLGNRVLGARVPIDDVDAPGIVQVDDEQSQVRYGMGVINRDTLLLQNDAQVAAWAETVAAGHADPELRVDSVQPAPPSGDLETALAAWPAVLATDVGDRWLFMYRMSTGRLLERTLGVLGIELEATPDDWRVTWMTTDAPGRGQAATGVFTLGVSELDGGDVLERPGLSV
jgi:hypothetical protein